MLAAAAALFSSQFLFNQKYEEKCGSSLFSAILFTFYSGIGGFAVALAANGFRLEFSFFSLLLAAICAAVGILYTTASVKAFETVNLSAYSVFAMLGGMLLPTVYGMVFCSEEITAVKLICCFFDCGFNPYNHRF